MVLLFSAEIVRDAKTSAWSLSFNFFSELSLHLSVKGRQYKKPNESLALNLAPF